ncbi:MAG: NUDIX hydrolase [Clostridiales bacterium]|nr:NUDIX hydrolase [Clostridiales bacterium]
MRVYDDSAIMETNISNERVYDGIILHIDHATNRLPNGRLAKREIARHVGASAIVPVDEDGQVTLVRQFRAPVDRVLLEIPAGKLDSKQEDRLEAAKRELAEETGLEAANWIHLDDLLTTVGFCDERISIYLATGLTRHRQHPDEDEFLNVVRMPLEEAVDLVVSDQIHDSKTVAGLLLAERMLRSKG